MKPALYAAITGGYGANYVGYLRVIEVTTEKRNKHGELVAWYGRDESGRPTNGTGDKIHFRYINKARAQSALAAAIESMRQHDKLVAAAEQALSEANRARRIEVERWLNKSATPSQAD